jgi:hypothetical protein
MAWTPYETNSPLFIKAVFHCSRFARAGEVNDFNLVKNQACVNAKKVECSSTSERVRARKSIQRRLGLDTYSRSRRPRGQGDCNGKVGKPPVGKQTRFILHNLVQFLLSRVYLKVSNP